MRHAVSVVTLALALSACADVGSGPEARVRVEVAALSLVDVADAEWSLKVESCVVSGGVCTQVAAGTVFEETFRASAFGSAGSASYVGPCDASTLQNRVSVRLLHLYDASAGAIDFRDPGTLTRWVACSANSDTPVRFDVTVMRDASQGFFDVAVAFDDIFCSAKYDCDAGDVLLDPATNARGRTQVLGFTCSGADGTDQTQMFLDDIVIDCGAAGSITLALPPVGGADGSHAALGPSGQKWLYAWASYRGVEALTAGDVRYFNVALGIGPDLPAGCTLRTKGTADGDPDGTLNGTSIDAGEVYPYVGWNITELAACNGEHPIDGVGSQVRTAYTSTTATQPLTFGHTLFAPALVPLTLMSSGIVTSNLIAALDPAELGQGPTKLADMSGNNRHCDLRGSITRPANSGVLHLGTGLDGTYVWCGNMTTPAYGVHYALVTKVETPATNNVGFWARSDSGGNNLNPTYDYGKLEAQVNRVLRYTANQGFSTSAPAYNVGQFHTLAVGQLDDSSARIYSDGVLAKVGNPGFARNNNPGLMIGIVRSSGAHVFFQGDIGPMLIYNRTLTDAEVLQNHNALRAYALSRGYPYGSMGGP